MDTCGGVVERQEVESWSEKWMRSGNGEQMESERVRGEAEIQEEGRR